MVVVGAAACQAALRSRPFLRGLLAAGAGYFPKATGHLRRRPKGTEAAILIYCVKGGGWCELDGRLHPVRKGDLLVLPPETPHAYGAHASNPWTIHWIHAQGDLVPGYLRDLGVAPRRPLLWLGDELQVVSLFHEVLQDLQRGGMPEDVFHASHTLAHLFSVLIRHRGGRSHETAQSVQKVAQSIIHMSERLAEPLRVRELAALAGLSPAHFTVLFKQQTGSAPRDYLQLLRSHRAGQLLRTTDMTVKEVGAAVGYPDPLHFSRAFKAINGVSPSEYRSADGH